MTITTTVVVKWEEAELREVMDREVDKGRYFVMSETSFGKTYQKSIVYDVHDPLASRKIADLTHENHKQV